MFTFLRQNSFVNTNSLCAWLRLVLEAKFSESFHCSLDLISSLKSKMDDTDFTVDEMEDLTASEMLVEGDTTDTLLGDGKCRFPRGSK